MEETMKVARNQLDALSEEAEPVLQHVSDGLRLLGLIRLE